MSIYKGDNLVAGSGLNIDLTPDPIPTEGSPRHVMSGGVYTALLAKEDTANKTTVVDANATDSQYPSAKAVYDALGDLDPVDIEYARDLYAPDWSKAILISSDALLLGYPAPKRGIFIGSTIPYDPVSNGYIVLNGIIVASGARTTNGATVAYVNVNAAVGDIIKSNIRMLLGTTYSILFVPYKRQ